jgi:selenophosphate synthetase-related protein
VLLIDGEGSFYRHYPFWDAATRAESSRLQSQLALLPRLAQAGITRAAKDISMGGLVGTAAMFAEACGCGLTIDLDAIPCPPEIDELAWLSCFPSFGFLLAVSSGQLNSLQHMVSGHPNLICASIGSFEADGRGVCLRRNEQTQQLWDGTTSLTGFGAVVSL